MGGLERRKSLQHKGYELMNPSVVCGVVAVHRNVRESLIKMCTVSSLGDQ